MSGHFGRRLFERLRVQLAPPTNTQRDRRLPAPTSLSARLPLWPASRPSSIAPSGRLVCLLSCQRHRPPRTLGQEVAALSARSSRSFRLIPGGWQLPAIIGSDDGRSPRVADDGKSRQTTPCVGDRGADSQYRRRTCLAERRTRRTRRTCDGQARWTRRWRMVPATRLTEQKARTARRGPASESEIKRSARPPTINQRTLSGASDDGRVVVETHAKSGTIEKYPLRAQFSPLTRQYSR